MSDSSSSELSDAPEVIEEPQPVKAVKLKQTKLFGYRREASPSSTRESSPEAQSRDSSPSREPGLADDADIAVLVTFRARFHTAFPKTVPDLGPQDIERGVVGMLPSEQVEQLLCALLGLVLNRKKPVERGHHGRALEDAISQHRPQWPSAWKGSNPLAGSQSFNTMSPTARILLLKTLMWWALNSSTMISDIIKDAYKQTRHDDDLNQPLSVQPWGADGKKRRYWLIEGQNDTSFRVYRESAPKVIPKTWKSVAGTLDEMRELGTKLDKEATQPARRLANRIVGAVGRLELGEEKRKRREYRQTRKAAFVRPEPGFSMYEGRTRGKRMRYTFSDDEDSDSTSQRRSARHSTRSSPNAPSGPTYTASGRQVRSRFARREGSVEGDSTASNGGNRVRGGSRRPGRLLSEEDEEPSSGDGWDGDEHDVTGEMDEDESMDTGGDLSGDDLTRPRSHIVRLKYRRSDADSRAVNSGIDPAAVTPSKPFSGVQEAHPRPQDTLNQDTLNQETLNPLGDAREIPSETHFAASGINEATSVHETLTKSRETIGGSSLPPTSNGISDLKSHATEAHAPPTELNQHYIGTKYMNGVGAHEAQRSELLPIHRAVVENGANSSGAASTWAEQRTQDRPANWQ